MGIWNKVLIGFIAVTSLVMFYMAARSLKVQKYWAELAIKYDKGIHGLRQQNEQLALDNLRKQLEMHKWLLGRGRVWRDCQPSAPQGAAVSVALAADHGIADKTRLFVFEQASPDKGGRYLGEFQVEGLDGATKIGLKATRKLTAREQTRLGQAKTPWVLYEVMPADAHDVFAGMKPEELKAILPESSLAEYARDGSPAADTDPADCKADGKYVRFLRHYEFLLASIAAERTEIADLQEAANRDKQYMEDAVAGAKTQQASLEGEKTKLAADQQRINHELQRVVDFRAKLEKQLDGLRKAVDEHMASHRAMVLEIEKSQRQAAQAIARRVAQQTSTMAQAGAAGGSSN